MQQTNRFLIKFLAALCAIIMGVSGCKAGNPSQTSSSTQVQNRATSTVTAEFLTPIFTRTVTPLPTNPASTATMTNTATEVPSTSTNTPSPIPTLNRDEEDQVVRGLLKDNRNCPPACLWGVVPGRTRYEDVRYTIPFSGRAYEKVDPSGKIMLASFFYQLDQDGELINLVLYFNIDQDGLIQSMQFNLYNIRNNLPVEEWYPFTLPGILTAYGEPSNVIFVLLEDTPQNEDIPIFSLILVYEDPPLAVFIGSDALDNLTPLCLSNLDPESFGTIYWGENPYEGLRNSYASEKNERIVQFVDVEAFYQAFVNSDQETCIQLNKNSFEDYPNP